VEADSANLKEVIEMAETLDTTPVDKAPLSPVVQRLSALMTLIHDRIEKDGGVSAKMAPAVELVVGLLAPISILQETVDEGAHLREMAERLARLVARLSDRVEKEGLTPELLPSVELIVGLHASIRLLEEAVEEAEEGKQHP
jgi:hypothetical protein